MTAPALLARAMQDLEPVPAGAGFAVSGGSDSLGLLLLLAPALQARGVRVAVVTVDHGLRPAAADEARFVAALCARHGWAHDTLHWQHDGQGNLSKAAREGRYRLMGEWARARGLDAVLLGHTRDDQAETFLMRLARGAGVDGLSAMAPVRVADGIRWARPLLGIGRAELRAFLTAQGQSWCDDPSNDDPAYERVRIRQAMGALATLGLTPEAIAQSAGRLRRARGGLAALALAVEATALHGSVVIPRAAFDAAGDESRERLLSQAIRWVAGQGYPPRGPALAQAVRVAQTRGRFGCHGALVSATRAGVTVSRESRAVADVTTPTDALWDGRWRLHGPHDPALHVAALGERGLQALPQGLDLAALPRAAWAVTPAVWRGSTLVAAPCLDASAGWQAETPCDFTTFREYD